MNGPVFTSTLGVGVAEPPSICRISPPRNTTMMVSMSRMSTFAHPEALRLLDVPDDHPFPGSGLLVCPRCGVGGRSGCSVSIDIKTPVYQNATKGPCLQAWGWIAAPRSGSMLDNARVLCDNAHM